MTRNPNITETLERAARETQGKRIVTLIERGEASQFGWDHLHQDSLRIGAWLKELGIKKDDRVAIIMPTSRNFLNLFFGILQAGATPVPLYPPIRLGKMEEYLKKTAAMLAAASCRILFCDPLSERVLGRLLDHYVPELGIWSLPLLSKLPRALKNPECSRLALIQFSSGTTVAPKPVGLTHEQLLANMRQIYHYVERRPEDMMLSWLPLYHDMGLVGALLGTLYGAGPLTLLRPEDFLSKPFAWLDAISKYRATISVAPNFAYNLCASKITEEQAAMLDLSCWRIAMNGAEPVTAATMAKFAERFAVAGFNPQAFKPVYGLSEAALAVTMTPVMRPYRTLKVNRAALQDHRIEPGDDLELVSLGLPIAGIQVETRDQNQQPLPERTVGQIWIKGASVMDGYYGITQQPFIDGWLDTGDEGFWDDGELFVVGRTKDIIIINGKNHVPQDIEAAIDHVDGVRTGCSVAVGHCDHNGEALYVFTETYATDHQQLQRDISLQITAQCHIHAKKVVICPPGTLPRTSSGKMRRHETLRLYLRGDLQAPRKVTPLRLTFLWASSRISYAKAALRRRFTGVTTVAGSPEQV